MFFSNYFVWEINPLHLPELRKTVKNVWPNMAKVSTDSELYGQVDPPPLINLNNTFFYWERILKTIKQLND